MFKKALATTALLMVAGSAAHAQFIVYDNTVGFDGTTGIANGGATAGNAITTLIADDINMIAGAGGQSVTQFSFEVANFDTATFTARARIRFYDTAGTGGGPGTALAGFSFNPISFTGGNTSVFFTTLTAGQLVIPTNGKLWAGITFDNASGSTATVANLNNLGQEVYTPPATGSSSTNFFQSTETAVGGSYLANNPGGTIYTGLTNGTTTKPGNFAWQFQIAAAPAPEPSQYAAFGLGVLGLGALALKARRRSAVA